MKILTIGTFDIFHRGHVKLLETCRKLVGLGGWVEVGVNSDAFVREYRGAAAIQDELTRLMVVRGSRWVDGATLNMDNGASLIKQVKPDILLIGSDWAKRDYYVQIGMTQDDLDKLGITLLYATYTLGISSTDYRQRLNGI